MQRIADLAGEIVDFIAAYREEVGSAAPPATIEVGALPLAA